MSLYSAGDYKQAEHIASQIIDIDNLTTSKLSERRRIEIINTIAQSSLKDPQKDMEHSIRLWKEGITGARSLKSEQRFSESVTTYDTMEALWPGEQRIKDLRELTVHW